MSREVVVPAKTVVEDESDDDEDEERTSFFSARDYYDRFVRVDEQTLQDQLNAPQRSDAWKRAREGCLTASSFGAAAGNNPYQSPDALLKDKLWSTFQGNYATEYGTLHEQDARFEFEAFAKDLYPEATFSYPNLVKNVEAPWLAVSPDGLVQTSEGLHLIEFKCPLRDTDEHPYAKHKYCIPPYYFDQIQGIMGYYSDIQKTPISCAWFVVWQQHQTWIVKVPFDRAYWDALYIKLHAWYFDKYLPALVHKYNKTIAKGEIVPTTPLLV